VCQSCAIQLRVGRMLVYLRRHSIVVSRFMPMIERGVALFVIPVTPSSLT
jgi:hypothetical protein